VTKSRGWRRCSICGGLGHNAKSCEGDRAKKYCPGCEEILDRDLFYPSKERYDGRTSRCKQCHNFKRSRGLQVDHCSVCGATDHSRGYHKEDTGRKYCPSCEQVLPKSSFSKQSSSPSGLQWRCKECFKEIDSVTYKEKSKVSFEIWLKTCLNNARKNARQRGRPCDVDLQHLMDVFNNQAGSCYYTGQPLSLESGKSCLSMDRLNPKQGYVPGNIVLTSWGINQLKSDLTEHDFLTLCRLVVSHHGTGEAD
jgi:hypothetical protein